MHAGRQGRQAIVTADGGAIGGSSCWSPQVWALRATATYLSERICCAQPPPSWRAEASANSRVAAADSRAAAAKSATASRSCAASAVLPCTGLEERVAATCKEDGLTTMAGLPFYPYRRPFPGPRTTHCPNPHTRHITAC